MWILEVVRAVMGAPEERHHLPPLGDKEPYNTPRKYKEESESELLTLLARCYVQKKRSAKQRLYGGVAPRRPQAAASSMRVRTCVPLYSTSATASLNVNEMMLAILKLSKIT